MTIVEARTRELTASTRLLSVIKRHGAATSRTLEQKISDAGPNPQRIDPHILTPVRNRLVQNGQLKRIHANDRDWYALPDTPEALVEARIKEQFGILHRTLEGQFPHLIGHALEVAVFRAIRASKLQVLGGFPDLAETATTGRLRKEEPPSNFGGHVLQGNKRFDFLVGHGATWAGIECKNIREWLYPDRTEIKQMLAKAVELNIPAILIGRRIPFVTRQLLAPAGIMVWETLNQLYPIGHDQLAAQMQEKTSLGFFDIRVTDQPSCQLTDFITRIIPEELPNAVNKFSTYKDLIAAYALGKLTYRQFAVNISRQH